MGDVALPWSLDHSSALARECTVETSVRKPCRLQVVLDHASPILVSMGSVRFEAMSLAAHATKDGRETCAVFLTCMTHVNYDHVYMELPATADSVSALLV